MTARYYLHGDVVTHGDPDNPFAIPGTVFCRLHDSFGCTREEVTGPCRGCMKRLARDLREAGANRPANAPSILDPNDPCDALSRCTCRRKKKR